MKFGDIKIQLQKLTPNKNNVIVIKILDDIDVEEAQQMGEFVNSILEEVAPETKVIMLSCKVDITQLSEQELNSLGWYKRQDTDDILGGLF